MSEEQPEYGPTAADDAFWRRWEDLAPRKKRIVLQTHMDALRAQRELIAELVKVLEEHDAYSSFEYVGSPLHEETQAILAKAKQVTP